MKKIAIVTEKLYVGGIERALINMLHTIDYKKYNIDLYVLVPEGKLAYEVPENVNVIYLCKYSNIHRLKKNILSFRFKKCIALFKLLIAFSLKKTRYKKNVLLLDTFDCISKEYDIAISYHNPVSFCTLFVATKIKSNKKVMWVHSDINQYLNTVDECKEYYYEYDKIFCVSIGSRKNFIERYPNLSDKTDVFYNPISKEQIKSRIYPDMSRIFTNEKVTKILTVCRLSPEKGVDLIPKIAKNLKENNIKFQWIIIGKGNLDNELREQIKINSLSNEVILYGEVLNPYNAMNECDIYVQPSRYEAYCISVAEAKCLEKPIVATNIIGINEQIISNENGVLCDFQEDEFSNKIIELINNQSLLSKIKYSLINEELDTRLEIKKIYNMIP